MVALFGTGGSTTGDHVVCRVYQLLLKVCVYVQNGADKTTCLVMTDAQLSAAVCCLLQC